MFQTLRTLRKHDAVLKTWVNSWATSDRYKESLRLPCIFGCSEAIDRMDHYVMCPFLFLLLRNFCPQTPSCPVERLGLINPTRETLLTISCAFAGYHAVRRGLRSLHNFGLDYLHAQNADNSPSDFVARTFAEAFWSEAVDCRLQCRHYRPSAGTGAPVDTS